MSRATQFLRFCLIGGVGFGVDVAVLYLARGIGMDLYSARLVSFIAAATFTWLGNRRFTFGTPASSGRRLGGEWATYLVAMTVGGGVNYGVYAALITWSALFNAHPWLAVAAGTGAGLSINFLLARKILFRSAGP